MAFYSTIATLIGSSLSTNYFYKAMNFAFNKLYGEYNMLHFPLFKSKTDSLIQAQINLTDYCISKLPSLEDKKVLDIGCGNGVQSIYLYNNYSPKQVIGVDINSDSISIARDEKKNNNLDKVDFYIDNAQKLTNIKDNSIDIVINIESAFHYPDKGSFIKEISRVLKPNGHFLIADILTTKKGKRILPKFWYKKMYLNHWSIEDYNNTFQNSKLKINSQDDVTELIISGFNTYKNWYSTNKRVGVVLYAIMKIFIVFNVRINVYLFKNRRKYIIFSGIKS